MSSADTGAPSPSAGTSASPAPVLVRGTGLLGASIGLALRAAGTTVLLHDPSPSALAVARDIGAGRPVALDDDVAPEAVVAACPPDVTAEVVADSLRRWPEAVVLDVASVKTAVADALSARAARGELSAADLERYVGTHPMAGRERSGPVAARGTLFLAAPWVVCPGTATSPRAVEAARSIAGVCGASVRVMDAAAHDEAVALTSHLPQVAASLVASRLQGAPASSLELAGNGLRDTTRIAASDPQLWTQILAGNAPAVLEALRGVREDVDRLIGTLEAPDAEGARLDMARLIAEGNAGHARIPGKHGAPPQAFAVVTVIVDDTPGQLAAVLAHVGEAGVNVEDLRMDHASGHEVGMVEVSVLPARRDELAEALSRRGWKVV